MTTFALLHGAYGRGELFAPLVAELAARGHAAAQHRPGAIRLDEGRQQHLDRLGGVTGHRQRGADALEVEVPAALAGVGVAEAHGAVRDHRPTGRPVEQDTCLGATEGWRDGAWGGSNCFVRSRCQLFYDPATSPGWRTLAPGQTVVDSVPAYGGYAGRWRAKLVFRFRDTRGLVPDSLQASREFGVTVP